MKNFRPLSTFSILVGCWLVLGNLITHSSCFKNVNLLIYKATSCSACYLLSFGKFTEKVCCNDYLLNQIIFPNFFGFFNCKITYREMPKGQNYCKVCLICQGSSYLNLEKLLNHEVKFLALSTNTEHDFDLWAVCTYLLACFENRLDLVNIMCLTNDHIIGDHSSY